MTKENPFTVSKQALIIKPKTLAKEAFNYHGFADLKALISFVGSTPKFAKMVSSKYSETGATRVQIDLDENHGRYISRSFIQDISEAVAKAIEKKQEK